MNKNSNLVFFATVLAAFSIANAQEAAAPAGEIPVPVTQNPVPQATAVPAVPIAEVAEVQTPPTVTDSAAIAQPQPDSAGIALVAEEPKPKKKRRTTHPRADFAVVDVPANFEIQARKVMPVDAKGWGTDNLDTWWGRANLMVLTESENFIGKVHLRMYPGEFKSSNPNTPIDFFQLYEAWAWHRGDYFNLKIGRWDNTTRFGSMAYGGYVDAKKDKHDTEFPENNRPNRNRREAGFLSTYAPENALQFGFNDFSENVSLDVALISSDANLNQGDLRVYFYFKDLAGMENMNIGVGYRSNIFDEIYSRFGDVTHTVDLGVRMPLIKDVNIIKSLSIFGEIAVIGLDDEPGDSTRADNGKSGKEYNPAMPILGGLDFSLYRGVDKIVVEAEYDGNRKNKTPGEPQGSDRNVRDIQGSIYLLKKLNDRFTLHLGMQSEHNTKDFSFAGRLQGRIN
jgi:hypothetical protein